MKPLTISELYDKHYKKGGTKMGKLKNTEKHEYAACVIKYLKELAPELTPKEMRRIFINAYHDLTKQLNED